MNKKVIEHFLVIFHQEKVILTANWSTRPNWGQNHVQKDKVFPLVLVGRKLNEEQYSRMLTKFFLCKHWQRITSNQTNPNFVFQHDNTTVHRAKMVQKVFEK